MVVSNSVRATHQIIQVLEDATDMMESIIDQLPGLFVIINKEGAILRGNKTCSQIFGLHQEKLLHRNFSDLFSKETWEIFLLHIKSLLNEENKNHLPPFETDLKDRSDNDALKSYLWFVNKIQIKTNSDEILFSIVGEDISDLRQSENKLVNIFSSIPIGILTVDCDGLVDGSFSSYLRTMLEKDNIIGSTFQDLLFEDQLKSSPADTENGIKAFMSCFHQDEIFYDRQSQNFPELIRYKALNDGNKKHYKWFKISYHPIYSDGCVERFLINIEDQTKIVQAERLKDEVNNLEQQNRAIYEAAIRDPLTGLYTRLHLKNSIDSLLEAYNREIVSHIGLIFFDIDHFKSINDTYGHKSGDEVLAKVAGIILEEVRTSDMPVRYGGEEFLVFIQTKEGNVQIGKNIAERVRKRVENSVFSLEDKDVKVTISGGVTSYQSGELLEDFIKRADEFLYQAKQGGRNRIISD